MSNLQRLPRPVLSSYEWQMQGTCRTADPEAFFPAEASRGRNRASIENRAKAMCAQCPVIEECLDHAMRVREPYGVWGGLTAEERNQLQRRRAG
jgi:WhiB family transcriptional regulator, redox-sensing transcriptional regulator